MSADDADMEQRAWDLFDKFLRDNRAELLLIAHQGDGRCGALHQRMADILIGPQPPKTQPRTSSRMPVRSA